MKQSRYEVFLKILELGSLTRAAEVCNYSQSAVSQIVRTMESELGVTLLYRSPSGVGLTSEGEQLLPYLQTVSRAYTELNEKAAELRGVISGLLRIGTFASASCHLLPPLLKKFKTLHPGVRFELYQGDYRQIEEWIAEGIVDFGFVTLPTLPEFETIHILDDPLMAVLPPGHPCEQMDAIPLTLFAAEPTILLEGSASREMHEMFRKYHIKPHSEFFTEDNDTAMAMVESGLGISILASMSMQRACYQFIKKPLDPPAMRRIGIAVRSRAQSSSAVRRFLDFVEASLSCPGK